MRSNPFNTAIDALMEYGPCLPLTLTQKHSSAVVRVIGVFAFFVWALPAFAVVAIPILVAFFGCVFVDAINGEL
jgi:hypothetical protein